MGDRRSASSSNGTHESAQWGELKLAEVLMPHTLRYEEQVRSCRRTPAERAALEEGIVRENILLAIINRIGIEEGIFDKRSSPKLVKALQQGLNLERLYVDSDRVTSNIIDAF